MRRRCPWGTVAIEEVNPGFGPLFTRGPSTPCGSPPSTWVPAARRCSGGRTGFGPRRCQRLVRHPRLLRARRDLGATLRGRRRALGQQPGSGDRRAARPRDRLGPVEHPRRLRAQDRQRPRAAIRQQLDREVRAVRQAGDSGGCSPPTPGCAASHGHQLHGPAQSAQLSRGPRSTHHSPGQGGPAYSDAHAHRVRHRPWVACAPSARSRCCRSTWHG